LIDVSLPYRSGLPFQIPARLLTPVYSASVPAAHICSDHIFRIEQPFTLIGSVARQRTKIHLFITGSIIRRAYAIAVTGVAIVVSADGRVDAVVINVCVTVRVLAVKALVLRLIVALIGRVIGYVAIAVDCSAQAAVAGGLSGKHLLPAAQSSGFRVGAEPESCNHQQRQRRHARKYSFHLISLLIFLILFGKSVPAETASPSAMLRFRIHQAEFSIELSRVNEI
jgi:hypothetical protein